MKTPRWPFVVVRIYLGIVFVLAGVTQWRAPQALSSALAAAPTKAWPILHGFVTAVLVPHAAVIPKALAIVHVVIGCLLIAGLATRWVATVAVLLLLTYTGVLGGLIYGPNPSAAFAALALTTALAAPSRSWSPGVDGGPVPLWTVVPLRLYLACAFARAVWNKIGSRWAAWPDALRDFGTMNLPHEAGWYRAFMTSVVLPHAKLFAGLVACGEVTVAVCLVLGLGTRIAAIIGMILTLNYFLLKGDAPWSISNDIAFVVGLGLIAFTGAGRVLGLDALWRR